MFLDLGTNGGICVRNHDTLFTAYGFNLGDKEKQSVRFVNYYAYLEDTIRVYGDLIKVIAYENAFHQKGAAQESFLGLLGIVKLFAGRGGLPLYKIATPTAKKFGVGANTSNKDVVLRVVNEKWKDHLDEPLTNHDAADAITVGDGFYGLLETNPDMLKLAY